MWAKTITVSYNANGGSGAPSSQSYTVYNSTTSHAFTLSSTKPTYSGWTFKGWATSSSRASSGTVDYAAGASATFSSSATLYAVWSKTTYLYYNANGGSGAPSTQSYTIYYPTTSHSFTVSSTTPTRSGYTFKGWATSSTSTSVSNSSGSSKSVSSSATLYAVWAKTITVSYNANGGSGAPSSQSYTVYNSTTSHAFTLSSTKPTYSGWTFKGWATSSSRASSGTVDYAAGASATFSSSATLYAVWKPNWSGATEMPLYANAFYNVGKNGGLRVSLTTDASKSAFSKGTQKNSILQVDYLGISEDEKYEQYYVTGLKTGSTTVYLLNSSNKVVAKKTVKVISITSGKYEIESLLSSNLVLDIQGKSKKNSARMIVYTRNGGTNQQYQFKLQPNGTYEIVCVHSKKCVDVQGGGIQSSAAVIQYTWKKGTNQMWGILVQPDNSLTFMNYKSKMAFDVQGGKVVKGAKMIQYKRKDSNNSNQRWWLRKVG